MVKNSQCCIVGAADSPPACHSEATAEESRCTAFRFAVAEILHFVQDDMLGFVHLTVGAGFHARPWAFMEFYGTTPRSFPTRCHSEPLGEESRFRYTFLLRSFASLRMTNYPHKPQFAHRVFACGEWDTPRTLCRNLHFSQNRAIILCV